MKAISLHQPWASMIASGEKTIETRNWPTSYRGELLIVSTKKPVVDDLPLGMALCVVTLVDCFCMTKADEPEACCEVYLGAWAWWLQDVRVLKKPFPVRGSQGFYEVESELICQALT